MNDIQSIISELTESAVECGFSHYNVLDIIKKSEQGIIFNPVTSRFAKAGDPSDCGHDKDGNFSSGNDCAKAKGGKKYFEGDEPYLEDLNGFIYTDGRYSQLAREFSHSEMELDEQGLVGEKGLFDEPWSLVDPNISENHNLRGGHPEFLKKFVRVSSNSDADYDVLEIDPGDRDNFLVEFNDISKNQLEKIQHILEKFSQLKKVDFYYLGNEGVELSRNEIMALSNKSDLLKLMREKGGKSKFAKAGSAEDCGHEVAKTRKAGKFAPGNTCAGEGNPEERSLGKYRQKDLPPSIRGHISDEDLAEIKSPKTFHDLTHLYELSRKNHDTGTLPTVRELKAAAILGESTRGQYEWTGEMMKAVSREISSNLGKEIGEKYAHIWAALNSVLSSQTEYRMHTIGSMRLMKMWIDAGEPTDEKSINNLISEFAHLTRKSRTGGEVQFYTGLKDPEGYKEKWNGIRRILSDPDRKNFYTNVTKPGHLAKTPEFYNSWFEPHSFAYDKWMSRLTKVPITDKNKRLPIKESVKQQVEATRKKIGHLLKGRDAEIFNEVTKLQEKLLARPAVYLAYKAAAGEAAKQLSKETGQKWDTRSIQESVWSALIAIATLKTYGLHNEEIPDSLTHEMVHQSWDIQALINNDDEKGNIKDELRGLGISDRILGSIDKWEKYQEPPRPPQKGKVNISDREAVENLVARVPTAGIGTKLGKRVYLPNKETGEIEEKKRFSKPQFSSLSRPSTAKRSIFSKTDKDGNLVFPASKKSFTALEVGQVISDQYGNKARKFSPESRVDKWITSSSFHLVKNIPLWVFRSFKFIEPDDKSYSTGPIFVDDEKVAPKHQWGSFLSNQHFLILDGKHRYYQEIRSGKETIDAYVGSSIKKELSDYIKKYKERRDLFECCLDDYYEDGPNGRTKTNLRHSAGECGLSKKQIDLILNSKDKFNIEYGEFGQR